MDELQKKIDDQLKKATGQGKNTFNKDQLEDIILTPEETIIKNKGKEDATAQKDTPPPVPTLSLDEEGGSENTPHFVGITDKTLDELEALQESQPKHPKTIAELLSLETNVAKNPPKAPPLPPFASKLKGNLKEISYYQQPDSPIVKRLRTLKGDVEEAMRSGKATLVSMASAEVERQSEQKQKLEKVAKKEQTIPTAKKGSRKATLIIASLLSLLLIGGGIGAIYFFNKKSLEPIKVIAVPEATAYIPIQFETKIATDKHNASYLKSAVAAERIGRKANLNEVGAIYLSKEDQTSATSERALTTNEFFTALEMRAPEELTRTLSPEFMLGTHHYLENQSFLIFKTDSYESAVAGMSAWEPNLEEDVGKFLRTPSDFAYTTSSGSVLNRRVFKDAVIKNNDAQVIYDDNNKILFFYTFLKDRETLIMATNPETLGAIITGLSARKLQR